MEIRGKEAADKIKMQICCEVNELKQINVFPKLAIMRVGNRKDDVAYENRLKKNAEELGIEVIVNTVEEDEGFEKFKKVFSALNDDESVHGIILFRPLKIKEWEDFAQQNIKPEKDVDCMGSFNLAKSYFGDFRGILPATPCACIEILKHYGYEITGKNVVIVNRSMVLGKPLAMMFLNENATVTTCHSKTKNLREVTKNADIVVTGIGKAGFFDSSYFGKDAIVLDVGINFDEEGMIGDVSRNISENVSGITPVPGGIGVVTGAVLFSNLLKGMKSNQI